MAKIIALPPPKRHCLMIVFNRGLDVEFRLELLDAVTGESLGVARNLVLYEVVSRIQSMNCASEKIAKVIDSMLIGQQSALIGTDLTEEEIARFSRLQS